MTRHAVRGAIALIAAAALLGGTPARAGDSPPNQAIVDEILAMVPDDADNLTAEQEQSLIDGLAGLAGALPAASGSGSSNLTGPCGGFAFSYDGDGAVIDAAFDLGDGAPPQDLLDGGQAFTSGNPFTVDTDGRVTYFGFAPRSGDGPENHSWNLDVGGVQVASGGDPNEGKKNRNAGTIEMDEELPFPLTAKFPASGEMTSNLETCSGSGYVEINGNGLLDPVGLAGLGLTLLGLVGLLFNAPPARTWKAG